MPFSFKSRWKRLVYGRANAKPANEGRTGGAGRNSTDFRFRRLLFVAAFFSSSTAFGQTPNPMPAPRHRFIVVCHRGDHEHAPENTLRAYADAIDVGADFVEIDLRTTVDSQLVIMHDATVNRMTDGTGLVKDLPYDSLRRLKVRDHAHPEWGTYDIPTFDEVLRLCKDRIYIYLDFKNADPAAAYREIRRFGMESQVVVYINAPQQFVGWRRVAPAMPLMVSLPGTIRDADSLGHFLDRYHPDILDGDWEQYTPEMVRLAVQKGYFVLPDIEGPGERPALWEIPVGRGIVALQTDHPSAFIDWLKERSLR